MTNLHHRIARAMCCPGTECISPTACYMLDKSRSVPVDLHKAAAAVEALFCEIDREFYKAPGPYSRTTHLPGSGVGASGFSGSAAPTTQPGPETAPEGVLRGVGEDGV
jgi:hypothetical protein